MSTTETTTSNINNGALVAYATLALPLALCALPLYLYLPDYYNRSTGLSLASLGAALLIVRSLDAISDPIAGWCCDRWRHQRPLVMNISALALALGMLMLFNPSSEQPLLWFGASMFITTTAFSFLIVQFVSTGSLWGQDQRQKTRIAAARDAMTMLGLCIATVLPWSIGFANFAYFVIAALALGLLLQQGWLRRRLAQLDQEAETNFDLAELMSQFWRLRFFYGSLALNFLALAIPPALLIFFVRDYLGAEQYLPAYLLVYFLSGAIGLLFLPKLARRQDPARLWLKIMLVSVFAFGGVLFLQPGDFWHFGIICALSGMIQGADQALPAAIISEQIDRLQSRAQTGKFFALINLLNKAALALGSFIVLSLLDLAAFQPAGDNSSEANQMLLLSYALLPCLCKLLAASLWWRWLSMAEGS